MKHNTITLNLTDGLKLVAEATPDSDYKEIYIGIANKNDVWLQTLACVKENYIIDEDEFHVPSVIPQHKSYDVHVWEDPDDDLWTHVFSIPLSEFFEGESEESK